MENQKHFVSSMCALLCALCGEKKLTYSEISLQKRKSKVQHEGRPLAFYRLHLDISFVKHHDLFAKTQSNPTSCFPRTKERNKNFVEKARRYPSPVIGYFDNRPMIRRLKPGKYNPRLGLIFHRLHSIDQ